VLLVTVVLLGSLSAGAQNLYDGLYEAFHDEKLAERFTPTAHQCIAHCGRRTVQETRVRCTVVDRPAHIGGEGPSWEIHEETWLVEEHISVDTQCNETVRHRSETQLAAPQYWPEDDIWNPVPYEETGLASFNCADLPFNRETNQTSWFTYRIVVGYVFGCR
jgi:hypothetical protein